MDLLDGIYKYRYYDGFLGNEITINGSEIISKNTYWKQTVAYIFKIKGDEITFLRKSDGREFSFSFEKKNDNGFIIDNKQYIREQ